jgi:hypothetical protein
MMLYRAAGDHAADEGKKHISVISIHREAAFSSRHAP